MFLTIKLGYVLVVLRQNRREFELQSRYYIRFRTKYPEERYKPLYSPSFRLNSTITVLLERWLWH